MNLNEIMKSLNQVLISLKRIRKRLRVKNGQILKRNMSAGFEEVGKSCKQVSKVLNDV